MVSRYGGRKEPTVHCFMSHCVPPQQHQHPPPMSGQFRIISTNTGRPDVSFHVTAPVFPGPQQGGPNGPPGGPQGMSRSVHHPGPHHGGPPGPGNSALPPQGSNGGPGQPGGQVQQQSQNQQQGPTPTSTPPGQDMGKQPPQHLQQGQQAQQMAQGNQQMIYSVSVPNPQRPSASQPFFSSQRGPTPRLPGHRGMVNMQNSNVSHAMFSHMQMPQIPQMFQAQVPGQLQQQMYLAQGMPIFPNQPRHPSHATSASYYAPNPNNSQIIMTHLQPYPGYPQSHTPSQQGPPYYYPAAANVLRPNAVQGGPVSQMSQAQPQQVVQGVQSSQQMGQPPVAMPMVPAGPPALSQSSGPQGGPPSVSRSQSTQRRRYALEIVDPSTMKAITIYDGTSTTNSPPGSENSSARQTPQPQPNADANAMDVKADFAARVAKVAYEGSNQPAPALSPSPSCEQLGSNAPDTDTSIQDQTDFENSKPIVVGIVDNSQWNSELVKENDATACKPDSAENNNVKLSADSDRPFPKEFVPSSSYKDPKSEAKEPMVVEVQPIQVIINKEAQAATILDMNSTPVVSANANTPAITLVHKNKSDVNSSSKSSQFNQSPRKKITPRESPLPAPAPAVETKAVEKPVTQNIQLVPNLAVSATQVSEPKPAKKEEFVPLAPKERREPKKEKSSRGRKEKSSQSRDRADKRNSSERKLSQSRERDSLVRKNSSQSRERDAEKPQQPPRNKTPQPVVAVVVLPEPIAVVEEPVAVTEAVSAPVEATEEEAKVMQPNGDLGMDSADGKAPKSHQKAANKRGKMRGKLTDKDVSDVEVAAASELEVVSPATTPTLPQEVVVVAASAVVVVPVTEQTTPPPAVTVVPETVLPAAVPVVNLIAKELEVVDTEKIEKEESDKLVLARNEENAKVSAAALKDDVPPVIENLSEEPKAPVPFYKQLSYKEDQWSPTNMDGKKKYDRDFLMELKEDPQSKKKPENLPDMDVVLKDNSNRQPQQSRGMPDQRGGPLGINRNHGENNFTPGFARTGGSNSRGPPVTNRKSQQGKPVSKSGKPNVIHMTLSLREDVKLHETENAWKPGVMKREPNADADAQVEDLYKSVRGVLNKLTPQKFDTLVNQVQSLPINTSDKLTGVINLVFEKAVDEPGFSVAYAQMCKVLSNMQVPTDTSTEQNPDYVNFRKLIVNRCQTEFEKNNQAELNKDEKLKDINLQTNPEKKKELLLLFEEEERKIRMKSVGNIRFIGELFKLQMLTTGIMHRCIQHLIQARDEESLECLCKLLTTIGKDLENKTGQPGNDLSAYFNAMREIANKRSKDSVSSRVRFMLQDVIELRQGKWIPRRDDANPKTMDQIIKDAEKETMDMHIALNNQPQTPRRQDDRGGGTLDRDRDRRAGNKNPRGDSNQQSNDGWTSVQSRSNSNRNLVVDTSKIKIQKTDIDTLHLGSGNQFQKWSRGATGATKSEEKKPSQPTFNSNLYSVLQDTSAGDEKRGSGSTSMISNRPGSGKVNPSPSMEKERMLSGFKTNDVNTGAQQTSRPASRDNSSRRGGLGSQPGSVTASNEDINRIPGDKTTLTNSKACELSEEDIEKKAKSVTAEFLSNNLIQECGENVIDIFVPSQKHAFVRECINAVLEKTAQARHNVGLLMCHLLKTNIISIQQYLAGLAEILESADDIAIDVPRIWLYLAEIIVPIMSSEVLSFAEFRQSLKAKELIVEVLQLLVKDKGPSWIRERWDKAGLKWSDFMLEEQVNDFIKKQKLEYTVGTSLPTAVKSSLTMEEICQKLITFLKVEPGLTSSFDQVCEWITANVGDRVKEPLFIRALMTAVCESAIFSTQNMVWKLNLKTFNIHHNLILKYVDNQEPLELQCLYAVQSLMNKLEHPQGLLCSIFQDLYDNSVFSHESFLAWEASQDMAEQAGKGVSLKSLTSFYTALKEAESSDES